MKKIALMLLILGFTGCGSEKDIDKIGAAQVCLNDLPSTPPPTSAQVAACTDKVAGMTSSGAQNIFCSAGFIREGFSNTKRYLDATESISTGTGQSQTQNMMGILSFTSTGQVTTDTVNAQNNFQYCYNSGSKGATLLAAFASLSMGLYNYLQVSADTLAGGDADCPAAPTTVGLYSSYPLATCIQGYPLLAATAILDVINPAVSASSSAGLLQTSIGNTILSTYALSCSSGGNANNALCDVFKTAIDATTGGTSNPRGVAANFFSALIPH